LHRCTGKKTPVNKVYSKVCYIVLHGSLGSSCPYYRDARCIKTEHCINKDGAKQ
jgi:hypothetical protein